MIYIVDTHAWIEYFQAGKKAPLLKKLFDSQADKFVTMECSLAELRGYALRNNADFNSLYNIVISNSLIFPVLRDQWINAAKIKHDIRKIKPKFGLMDAILVAKQRELKCKIISGDYDFKNLKDILYLGD